jgi:hypothetical protein
MIFGSRAICAVLAPGESGGPAPHAGDNAMNAMKIYFVHPALKACCFTLVLGLGYLPSAVSASPPVPAAHDGRQDFDWDYGTWKTHQKRLLHPLTGSTTWVEYKGTDVVRKIWDGANTGMIEAEGTAGHLEIFSVRMYDPDSHQWNIYFSNAAGGSMGQPVIGEFKDGRGEFYDQEPYNGRAIMVRFSVSDITATTCHFEQAFSPDGGKTWETNFIVDETLDKEESGKAR